MMRLLAGHSSSGLYCFALNGVHALFLVLLAYLGGPPARPSFHAARRVREPSWLAFFVGPRVFVAYGTVTVTAPLLSLPVLFLCLISPFFFGPTAAMLCLTVAWFLMSHFWTFPVFLLRLLGPAYRRTVERARWRVALRAGLRLVPEFALASLPRGQRDAHCAICLEESGGVVRRLPCGHQFHHTCIALALERATLCPLCRFDLLTHFVFDLSDALG
jgi:hypothetical protein